MTSRFDDCRGKTLLYAIKFLLQYFFAFYSYLDTTDTRRIYWYRNLIRDNKMDCKLLKR